MARRGRKRKSGKREGNGRIQRERGEDVNVLASRMPHRACEVTYVDFVNGKVIATYIRQSELHSEKAENPLGRYRLVGAISEEQYLAGKNFMADAMRCRRATNMRKEAGSIAGFAEPSIGTGKELDSDTARQWIMNYVRASESIGCPIRRSVIKHVVVQERDLNPGLFEYLFHGLDRLIAHYGLTT